MDELFSAYDSEGESPPTEEKQSASVDEDASTAVAIASASSVIAPSSAAVSTGPSVKGTPLAVQPFFVSELAFDRAFHAKSAAISRKRAESEHDSQHHLNDESKREGTNNRMSAKRSRMDATGARSADDSLHLNAVIPSTTFHRDPSTMTDYQGRSFVHPPTTLASVEKCFIPKRCIHTLRSHSMGVQTLRLFPVSSHLLLSGSLDATVKLWDAQAAHDLIRTYSGHSKGIRDLAFSDNGLSFASASYDRHVIVWDTETGSSQSVLSVGSIPYCTVFLDASHYSLLVGLANRSIVQYDLRSNEIVCTYAEHAGPVDTISLIERGRKMVTTADDKCIKVWDVGVPHSVKTIAEPWMHAMPAVCHHPTLPWLAMQGLDSSVYVVSTADKVRIHRSRVFRGHTLAGNACRPCISPDGRYLVSGDGEGMMTFWDWKSCALVKRMKVHRGAVMDCVWHSHCTSRLYTAGADGAVYVWD